MTIPTLSIITPVYNGAETIADCLLSVQRQSVDVEQIVVDGCSTDATVDVVRRHARPGLRLISQKDRGLYDAINTGLEECTGDVVGILNSDDFYPHDKVLESVASLFSNESIGASYGNLHYVDQNDSSRIRRRWRAGAFSPSRFVNGWMPPHPTFFIRRQYYEAFGGYSLQLGTAADYELMLRMLYKERVKAAYIDDVLVHMRQGGMSNVTLKARLVANRHDRDAWLINGLQPRWWTIAVKPLRKLGQWF